MKTLTPLIVAVVLLALSAAPAMATCYGIEDDDAWYACRDRERREDRRDRHERQEEYQREWDEQDRDIQQQRAERDRQQIIQELRELNRRHR